MRLFITFLFTFFISSFLCQGIYGPDGYNDDNIKKHLFIEYDVQINNKQDTLIKMILKIKRVYDKEGKLSKKVEFDSLNKKTYCSVFKKGKSIHKSYEIKSKSVNRIDSIGSGFVIRYYRKNKLTSIYTRTNSFNGNDSVMNYFNQSDLNRQSHFEQISYDSLKRIKYEKLIRFNKDEYLSEYKYFDYIDSNIIEKYINGKLNKTTSIYLNEKKQKTKECISRHRYSNDINCDCYYYNGDLLMKVEDCSLKDNINAFGFRTEYFYDENNMVIEEKRLRFSSGKVEESFSTKYTYDQKGSVTRIDYFRNDILKHKIENVYNYR